MEAPKEEAEQRLSEEEKREQTKMAQKGGPHEILSIVLHHKSLFLVTETGSGASIAEQDLFWMPWIQNLPRFAVD